MASSEDAGKLVEESTAPLDVSLTDDELDAAQDRSVETEKDEENGLIEHPFNPEKIKVNTINVVVQQIVDRVDHEEINLSPEFQRMRGIWNAQRKSQLVESLLLRIPIPVFYVAADNNDDWAVVDGVQRISTIYDYVKDQFVLTRLEYLDYLNGCLHSNLPRAMQRRIEETQLVINVIQPGTPDEVMYNIFHRINTGGMRLNAQEIRHAVNPGQARSYLEELSKTREFLDATDNSIRPTRMADRECILRFLAFHMDRWEEYSANSLNVHLGDAMKKIGKADSEMLALITKDFKKAMMAALHIFGNRAFRKEDGLDGRRRPINMALFAAWGVGLARCSQEQLDVLINKKEKVRTSFALLLQKDQEFVDAISYATGDPRRVQKRFQSVETLIQECL